MGAVTNASVWIVVDARKVMLVAGVAAMHAEADCVFAVGSPRVVPPSWKLTIVFGNIAGAARANLSRA
jgi:hypothetical protein